MNIVLHFLGLRKGGGRTDAINLLRVLPSASLGDDFHAIVPRGCGYEELNVPPNCTLHFESLRAYNDIWRIYFDNIILPRFCRKIGADLLFSMGNMGPIKAPCPHILMLRRPQLAYPLSAISVLGLKKRVRYALLRGYFQMALRRADGLILQTETMKKRVLAKYDVPCPIHIVGKNTTQKMPNANQRANNSIDRMMSSPSKLKILYLAKYYPHKNIEGACRAAYEARRLGMDVTLFVTIEKAESDDAEVLVRQIDQGRYGTAVSNLGAIDLSSVERAYTSCNAIMTTSLLESLSANYIEGMLYERPILASDRDFAREICGDAALYFDPLDDSSIVQAISRLYHEPRLASDLARVGRERYRLFDKSWDQIAVEYMNIFQIREVPCSPLAT